MNIILDASHVEYGKTELNSHTDIKRNPTKTVVGMVSTTQGCWMGSGNHYRFADGSKYPTGRSPDPGLVCVCVVLTVFPTPDLPGRFLELFLQKGQ